MASRGNTKLPGFYFPWPLRGIQLARQIDQSRENTFKLAPLTRAAYVDPQPVTANDPGNHDLSGWAIGMRDFRNKFRIWYDQVNLRLTIQHNVGTEAVETWDDMITIRESDGRVTIVQDGGLEAEGGFYNELPRNLATSGRFSPASQEWAFTHNLNTKPVLWDTFNLEDKSITPQSVDVSDPNTAYFYFSTPQSGFAVVTGEQARFSGIRVDDGNGNVFPTATRLGFNPHQFYASTDGHGMPVINLQPLDLSESDPNTIPVNLRITDTGASETFDLSTITQPKIILNQADFYFGSDPSGNPIINIRGGAGGGGSSGQFGTGAFGQNFSSSAEWVLNHGLGQANIVWNTYDDQGMAIIPNKVSVHDQNTAYFYFTPDTAGRAVVMAGPVFQAASAVVHVTETDGTPDFPSASKITFNSNDFYVKADSGGNPIVNFRGTAGSGGGTGDIRSDGSVAFAANESMGGFKITSLGTPTAATDAANKSYVDSKLQQFYNSPNLIVTDGIISKSGVSTLSFSNSAFYLDGSNPTVNLRDIQISQLDIQTRDVVSHGWLGCTLADTNLTVTSDGATITATWSDASGSGEGIRTYTASGIQTVAASSVAGTLTAGTDASPQANYIYVLHSAPTALVVSTSGYPAVTTAHTRVGYVLCQSAASLQTQGAYIVDNQPDEIHFTNPSATGHITHIASWIKSQPATWVSGVAATGTINTGPTPDTVTFSTTSGVVKQLHDQTFPAFTDPATIYVANHPSGAYTTATTMPGLTSGNTAIGGGDRIIVVLWGCISDNTGDCKLFLNLPSGYYQNSNQAIADANKYGNYTIPNAFKGTGFLIASFIYQYTTTSGGTYTLVQQNDLRGLYPSAFPGGTTAAGTEFPDSTFRIDDNADPTKQLAFEVSGITTGTTRTLSPQDRDGTIAYTDQLNDFYHLAVRTTTNVNPRFATQTLIFNANDFYLKANSKGHPTVNLRGTTSQGGSGITAVVQDLAPQLGGALDTNDFYIFSRQAHDLKIRSGHDLSIHANNNITINAQRDLTITAATDGLGTSNGITIIAGSSGSGGTGMPINIQGGNTVDTEAGIINIVGGIANTTGDGGAVSIVGGDTNFGAGGSVIISGGSSSQGEQGHVSIGTGDGFYGRMVNILDDLDMNVHRIHGVVNPLQAQDAATKNYVDLKFQQFYNNMGGSSGGGISTVTDGVSTYSNPTVLGFANQNFYISLGTGGRPVVNLRQSLEPLSAYVDFPVVGNFFLETFADHPSVIEDIRVVCRFGSAIGGFYIVSAANPIFRDGTKVGGGDPITVSTTPQLVTPTSPCTLAPGDGLKFAIYSNANAKGMRLKVRLRKI